MAETLAERKRQIDNDWLLIYDHKNAILPAIEKVVRLPMTLETHNTIAALLAAFCVPFLKVCKGAVVIDNSMSVDELISVFGHNVKLRMENGMMKKYATDTVNRFRVSLFNLQKKVELAYATSNPSAAASVAPGSATRVKSPSVPKPTPSVPKPRTTYSAADARADALVYTSLNKMSLGGIGAAASESRQGRPKSRSDYRGAAGARLYAGVATSTARNHHYDVDDDAMEEEFDDMPALVPESDARENARNMRFNAMLAKSRREGEALDMAQERAMVDGFFDYNPHTTTSAMEQQRYAREVAHHNDMIMRSDEAFQRQRFFGGHAFHDWRAMDNCMQYVTEMPLADQHHYGFH